MFTEEGKEKVTLSCGHPVESRKSYGEGKEIVKVCMDCFKAMDPESSKYQRIAKIVNG